MSDTSNYNNRDYDRKRFSWRQIRDCVEGSDAVKRAQEVYLPMPSGMVEIPAPAPSSGARTSSNQYAQDTLDYQRQYTPWWHPNPAYRAYMQRAKFPDITASTLRGLVGIATKRAPAFDLPSNVAYLEELATPCGMTLIELFGYCVSEVLQTGRLALVLDIRKDNTFYIAPYTTEAYTDWDEQVVNEKKEQTLAVFSFQVYDHDSQDYSKCAIVYTLEEGDVVVNKFVDDQLVEGPITLSVQGKAVTTMPIVNLGSVKNSPEPDTIPLLGVSDCALDVFRHSADLAQAHFLTCNPTLFVTGITDKMPKIVGSSVVVGLENPSANAFYPATDTSALSHVKDYMHGIFAEAVQYGAALLGPTKRSAESAEALALRQAASGATLVSVVDHVSNGILDILQLAASLSGNNPDSVEFEANKEFAELTLSAQDVTALVNSWMTGAISHETLLENFIEAGIVDSEKSAEDEINRIGDEGPAVGTGQEDQEKEKEEEKDEEK